MKHGATLPQVLLGVVLGGFADGIVLHQILQWHHMVSSTEDHPVNTVAGLEANTLGDGLFHAATWVAALAATMLLVRAWQSGDVAPPWRRHVGLLLLGWGLFNVVEGTVDHVLLGIHHVREGSDETAWDLAFLALGMAQIAAGGMLARVRKTSRRPPAIVVAE